MDRQMPPLCGWGHYADPLALQTPPTFVHPQWPGHRASCRPPTCRGLDRDAVVLALGLAETLRFRFRHPPQQPSGFWRASQANGKEEVLERHPTGHAGGSVGAMLCLTCCSIVITTSTKDT